MTSRYRYKGMTKETALRQAQEDATRYDLTIVVTFNPYGEDAEEQNYGYIPEGARKIFFHEEVVATILPKKEAS